MSERRNKCIQKIQEANIDAVVVATGATLQYLSECNNYFWQRSCMNNIMGFSSAKNLPESILYLDTQGNLVVFAIPRIKDQFEDNKVVVSYMDQFEDAMAPYIKAKKIAVGIDCNQYLKDTLKEVNKDIEVIDGADELFFELRAIKDEKEIEQMTKLAKFTDEAVMYVVKNLKEGMTQYEAEMMLMQYGFDHGIQDFSFPPTAGFKTRNTFTPEESFDFPRDTKLVPGTAIAFDVGYMDKGYCSDWGRTVYFGKAPEHVKNGYKALQQAQQYMVSKIVPYQTKVSDLYDLILEEVERCGFADVLRYKNEKMLGHQIGIDCHEFPMINPQYNEVLKPGMIFCSEPKMMFENECYMRVEDMILVTQDGAIFLSNFDRDLFEI
ncbi:MAG: Xaa-Pro peptidase family protein [Firmicutes bacterium]|nr:Xaa-Pro peptidase family protein [Bacillota bacterium]